MELLIGLFVVTYWACAAPRAIADAVATWRASKAGEFDFIDRDRDRRASRQERRAQAWRDRRAARHREAGGDGNYRPGAGAYFGDLYHGFWERKLQRLHARQAAREPYVYDPDAPTFAQRFTASVGDKVDRLRAARLPESLRRVGRAVWEPVGERRPTPPWGGLFDESDRVSDPDEWMNEREPAAFPPGRCGRCDNDSVIRYLADGNECCINCGWLRPEVCGICNTALTYTDRGWLHEFNTGCGEASAEQRRMAREDAEAAARDNTSPGATPTNEGDNTMSTEAATVAATAAAAVTTANTNGGSTMTATGDVHDVETCKNECEQLADDLGRVDTSLDVIDEAIRSARDATERIEAWLSGKNADDTTITGMRMALDMLNSDRIKELIDAVAAAKQGVQDTIDGLAPYEEASELVGTADGSILNGR